MSYAQLTISSDRDGSLTYEVDDPDGSGLVVVELPAMRQLLQMAGIMEQPR